MMIIMVLGQRSREDSWMENIWEFQQHSNSSSNGKLFLFLTIYIQLSNTCDCLIQLNK